MLAGVFIRRVEDWAFEKGIIHVDYFPLSTMTEQMPRLTAEAMLKFHGFHALLRSAIAG
jgi:hypothetical protein